MIQTNTIICQRKLHVLKLLEVEVLNIMDYNKQTKQNKDII